MPIRPIDMISVAPRSQEASHQQINDQQRMTSAQENVVQQFGKHVRNSAEVVVQTSKGEQKEYRYDAKEKGNGKYSGESKKKKKRVDDKDTNKPKEIKLSNFDIKI